MAQLDVGYSFRCGWGASLGAHLGGSFFDFEGPGVSGDLRERSYGFNAAATKSVGVSSRSLARLGLGVEYGEAQSWLRNLVVERSGPHNYFFGGFFRAAMRWAIADHWLVGPDATVSIYHAHSVNTALQSEYDWMGSSAFLGIGVDFALPHPESDTTAQPK